MWRSSVATRTIQTFESGATAEKVTAMRESGGSGAGLWLGLPTQPSHHLTDQEYTTSVRLRMSLDIFHNATCNHQGGPRSGNRICQTQLDPKGLHALLCKLGGHIIKRHNRIRDLLAQLLQEVSLATVNVEQHTGLDADQRRPDVDFLDHHARRQHIDVEIVTPHARAMSGTAAPHRAGSLIETGESTKRRKYPNVRLLPAVASHLGRYGQGFQTIIRNMYRQADESERSASIAGAYQKIGAEIQRANVIILGSAGRLL